MLSAVARVDLESAGITVSTMYPFLTDTEFVDSIKVGKEATSQMASSDAMQPQPPTLVAEAILELIRTGAEQADLAPEQFSGSYQS